MKKFIQNNVFTLTAILILWACIISYLIITNHHESKLQKDIFIREWRISKAYRNNFTDSTLKTTHGIHCFGFEHDFLEGGESNKDFEPKDWINHKSETDVIDFTHIFDSTNYKVAYAFSNLYSEEDKEMILAVGSDDGIKIWFNGELVHKNHIGRGTRIDNDFVPVKIKKGNNTCLIKVDNGDGGWGFIARLRERNDVLENLTNNIEEVFPSYFYNYTLTPGESLKINLVDKKKLSLFLVKPQVNIKIVAQDGKETTFDSVALEEKLSLPTTMLHNGLYELFFHFNLEKGKEEVLSKKFFVGNIKQEFTHLQKLTPALLKKNCTQKFEINWKGNIERLDTLINAGNGIGPMERSEMIVHQLFTLNKFIEYSKNGVNAFKDRKGYFICGYKSHIDNSYQYYQVFIPSKYDSLKQIPVVFHLHGIYERHMPFMNSHELNWIDAIEKREKLGEKYGFIVVWPYGRGNALYSGVGQEDIPKILEDIKIDYKIDTSKIYLVSYSNGATAALNNIMRFPNLFSAVAAIAPFTDYRINNKESFKYSSTHPYTLFMNANNPIESAQNLFNKSVYLLHGLDDRHSNIENSRKYFQKLKEYGITAEYKELPNSNHFNYFINPEPLVYQWLSDLQPQHTSHKIFYRTAQLKYNQAAWITINDLEKPYQFGEIEAENKSDNAFYISSKNINSYSLALNKFSSQIKNNIKVITNDTVSFTGLPPRQDTLKINVHLPINNEAVTLSKTPSIEGPIDHVFDDKFIVVYGTSCSQNECLLNKAEADDLAKEWFKKYFTKIELKKDIEITKSDIHNSNIILIGTLSSNKILKQIIKKLPIQLTNNSLVFNNREFTNMNSGIRMIYPNPLNDKKYVVIYSGITSKAIEGSIQRFGIGGWYDVMIYDERTSDDKLSVNTVGFFDNNWKLDSALLYAR